VFISHNVAVVSIEQVTMLFGEDGFQEKDVIGGRDIGGDLLCRVSSDLAVSHADTIFPSTHICQDAPRAQRISLLALSLHLTIAVPPDEPSPSLFTPIQSDFPYPQDIPRRRQ
jgi:hypothetical protein